MRTWLVALLAVCVLWPVGQWTGQGGARAAAPPAKDELIIGISQFPAAFHPNIEAMFAKTYILGFTHRPLTAYDAQWRLICMLCERLPTLENGLAKEEKTVDGKKGVAVSYTLRADAMWGDGTPVTTDDVLFTIDAGRHPLSGVTNSELYRRILKVEVKDKRTFILHLDRLTFDYNVVNDLRLLPAHLEKARFYPSPADYRTRNAYDQDTANPGLYNGPYVISHVVLGSHVVLERNSHWKGVPPAFRRIIIKAIENTASLEANVLSGSIDMIAGELGLPLDQAIAFEKRNGSRFQVIFKSGLIYEHLDANLDSPIVGDKRVRQALMYGMDRDALSKQLFDHKQPVAHSAVNPLDGVYFADVPKYRFDPAKAAKLLDEAGWKMQGKTRVNAKGEPLVIDLQTTSGSRSRELVAQVLQAQWRSLGIDTRIRTEPPRVFFGETVTRRHFPHLALYAWYTSPETVPRSTLHSEMVPNEGNNWSGQNYTGYHNPRMDQMIADIEKELDRTRRIQLWKELQALYADDVPSLPLFFRADAFILPKSLKGLVPTGHENASTLWVEHWRWENGTP